MSLIRNVAAASTPGSRRTESQSNPGWLGCTRTVAGRVTALSRSTAEPPRRAPVAAAVTAAELSATSTARATRARTRRRMSSRTHIHMGLLRRK